MINGVYVNYIINIFSFNSNICLFTYKNKLLNKLDIIRWIYHTCSLILLELFGLSLISLLKSDAQSFKIFNNCYNFGSSIGLEILPMVIWSGWQFWLIWMLFDSTEIILFGRSGFLNLGTQSTELLTWWLPMLYIAVVFKIRVVPFPT